jgi:hypothetical protein
MRATPSTLGCAHPERGAPRPCAPLLPAAPGAERPPSGEHGDAFRGSHGRSGAAPLRALLDFDEPELDEDFDDDEDLEDDDELEERSTEGLELAGSRQHAVVTGASRDLR